MTIHSLSVAMAALVLVVASAFGAAAAPNARVKDIASLQAGRDTS
jgi:hypothetical protein